MTQRIPSLTALQCLDLTVRYGSLSRAAEDLCLTQSAVSRQIKGLEEFLGRSLFVRRRQRLVPTAEGEAYAVEVRACLERLEAATLGMMAAGADAGVLTVAAPPTFGTRLLIPRLPDFQAAHPGILINFISRIGGSDLAREAVDVAILAGDGNWPHLAVRRLTGERLLPVCSPALLADLPYPPSPDDLRPLTLLHIATRPDAWSHWLERVGAQGVDGGRGPRFEHFTMAVQAAIAGLGVALLPTFVAEEELAAGRLVAPFPGAAVSGPAVYYAAALAERAERPTVRAFLDWLEAMAPELRARAES